MVLSGSGACVGEGREEEEEAETHDRRNDDDAGERLRIYRGWLAWLLRTQL
jgi:hypothetical protein